MLSITDRLEPMETQAHTQLTPNDPPIQMLTEADRSALLQHLQGLSPEDRSRRFGVPVTPAYLSLYVASVRFGRDVILGSYRNAELIAVCQLALYPGDSRKLAEVGLSIAAQHRRQGHATRILTACIVQAKEQGIEALEINYVYENTAMAKLCAKFGATRKSESGCVCATLELQHQTTPGLAPDERGRLDAPRQAPERSRNPVCALLRAGRGGLGYLF